MGWSAPPWVYRCQHNNIPGVDEANILGCGAMTRAFAARIAVRLMLFWTLPVSALPVAAAPATQGVTNEPCPQGSCGGTWGLDPGRRRPWRRGRGVCLKNGVHRLQVTDPSGASASTERAERFSTAADSSPHSAARAPCWVASGQKQRGRRNGRCAKDAPACSLPQGFFVDDRPLGQVPSKDSLEPSRFYFDHARAHLLRR
jgi:hypothetical protein